MQGVCQGYSLTMLFLLRLIALVIFIDADTRIKEGQIGDHEFIIVIFAADTTILKINYLSYHATIDFKII